MKVSMSAVWDRTAAFLSEHLGALIGIAALTIFLPNLIGEVLAPLKADGGLRLGLFVLAMALGVLSIWGQLAITAMALEPGTGSAQARATASRRLLPMVLVIVAIFAIAALLTLPVLVILGMNGVDLARLGEPELAQRLPPEVVAALGGYLLLLSPVLLWLVARFTILAMPVVAAEGLALGALGRAYRLTRGLALRIIAVVLLYVVVTWIATKAAQIVFGSVLRLIFDGNGAITIPSVVTALVVALVGTIFSVIGTVFAAKLYIAARSRDVAPPA